MPSPRIRKMSLSRALDKYLKTVSVHKKGHQQEFYRSNVIKRYPIALRNMDEITTVDIATYRDVRLAEINPRTGKAITGNTVRLELALLSSLFNIARVEWGTCRTNPTLISVNASNNPAYGKTAFISFAVPAGTSYQITSYPTENTSCGAGVFSVFGYQT
ncbi:shufflon-specific DNA recombinase [Escherichia coli]|nr:shufflon-specific DNA recombinase [Escherichia coli]